MMNIPLVEALEKMPSEMNFMKDLVTKKRTVCFKLVDNLHHYSVIASRSLVEKKENTEEFIIPYTIGNFNFIKVLCDLGASIKLIPLAVHS